jgi:hypothetical protein
MKKGSKKTIAWIAAAVAALFLAGWLLLFIKPTLPTPKFLRDFPVLRTEISYYEGVHTIVRGGQVRNVPETTVTERQVIRPEGTFEDLLTAAEQELTANRGWDLGALPKEKVARFYQRSTNTSVTLSQNKNQPQALISQTRFATPSDRFRNWWKRVKGEGN